MEAHLEAPLSTDALAARAGVSVRQLERLMRDTLKEAPSRYYLKLRLQAARNHLFYGDMPIQEIAQACGFSSPSVLSRAFKEHFGVSPREFRRQFSADRIERFRPELRQQFGLDARRANSIAAEA
jgi:AraC family carnitine catabolism transcriptional activator